MSESINELSADEVRKHVENAIKGWGGGAHHTAWELLEREAEKVTEGITPYKAKRAGELIYIKGILDKMLGAYEEEKHVNETGEETTYDAGEGSGE